MRKAWKLLAIVLAVLWGIGNLFPLSSQFAVATQPPIEIEDARLLTVAADPSGSLWAAWEADTGTGVEILYSRQIEGEWQLPARMASRPQAWDRAPSLAITADGTPWLAWSSTEKGDPDHSDILVSNYDGTGWTAPEHLPLGAVAAESCPACGGATEPTLAASPDGTLWLAWVGFDGVGDGIFAQHWDGSAWTLPLRVSAGDLDPSLYDRQPLLGVGGDGRPWLVWTGYQGGVDDEIYASYWTGSGWAPEQMVNIDDESLDTRPALWVDAQGRPWVAWQAPIVDELLTTQAATDEDPGRMRILTSRWEPSRRAWAPEQPASSALSTDVDEAAPTLLRGKQGRMRVAWLANGGTGAALAHSWWDGRRWTEPRLVQSDIPADGAAWVLAEDGSPALVWLDPVSAHQAPLGWAVVDDKSVPVASWFEAQAPPEYFPLASFVPNRYMAFGDSVTAGNYVALEDTYPYLLDGMLKAVVPASLVENWGVPGEGIPTGRNRLDINVGERRPQYVLFMEGTNDVSRGKTPAEIKVVLLAIIAKIRNHPVQGVELMLATITPRLDVKNAGAEEMNNLAIRPAAQEKGVPLCDQWQAFYASPLPLTSLIRPDQIHPTEAGLQLIADTFYVCVLVEFLGIPPDDEPPTTWIEPLPDESECGQVAVSWNGSDNLSYVVDYDVQVKIDGGAWTDWLLGTTATNGVYPGGLHDSTLSFRVRGRDVAGNQSSYSASEDTLVKDTLPPYEAGIKSLRPAEVVPFKVGWWGQDACSEVTSHDVQYKAGAGGTWQDWLTGIPASSADFSPGSPVYGEIYYFQVKAEDALGNKQSTWSDLESTLLARFSLSGSIYTTRHEPIVAMSEIQVDPALPYVRKQFESYKAFAVDVGDYDLTASASRSAGLPPIKLTGVTSDVSGLNFHLPAADDAVADGGFEGDLSLWRLEGSVPPTLTMEAHTGDDAIKLGGPGEQSHLSQVVYPTAEMNAPTLSFLVRLDQAGSASALEVTLEDGQASAASFNLSDILAVEDDLWSHVWYDIIGVTTSPVTITFTVSDTAAVILDEVSLGSALSGGGWTYLPTVSK